MSLFKKFYVLGAESADRRVAAALAPPALGAADGYLKASALVTAIDRATIQLQQWWLSSEAKRQWSMLSDRTRREPLAARRRALAMLILIAVMVHVMLTWFQGAHTGVFWIIIPALAALFAGVLLVGARASGEAN